jgi:hypothetical protein
VNASLRGATEQGSAFHSPKSRELFGCCVGPFPPAVMGLERCVMDVHPSRSQHRFNVERQIDQRGQIWLRDVRPAARA